MKRTIPAVYFQKQLNGVQRTASKPKVLELYEGQLRMIVGGTQQGVQTESFSGSHGWADVELPDDCEQ